MDVKLMSALMQLKGHNACGTNLNKAEKLLKTVQTIMQEGINQSTMLHLVAELNPSVKHFVTVIEKINEPKCCIDCSSPNIQYNNFRNM